MYSVTKDRNEFCVGMSLIKQLPKVLICYHFLGPSLTFRQRLHHCSLDLPFRLQLGQYRRLVCSRHSPCRQKRPHSPPMDKFTVMIRGSCATIQLPFHPLAISLPVNAHLLGYWQGSEQLHLWLHCEHCKFLGRSLAKIAQRIPQC